mmetsp:Transcript_73816/g.210536  ORF Transcript_73816/g.210536 Transcript_73816/m.210536 type:complete len:1260 (+) Transcript_73816:108-3887(+)
MTRAMAIVLALAAWPLSTSAFVNTKGRGLTNMARPLTAGRRNTATPLSMSAPAAEGKKSATSPIEMEREPYLDTPPFKKVMAANRAEIAVRIMRASTELNMESVGIYGYEDRNSAHRWGADKSFLLPSVETPVGAYLNIDAIIKTAVDNGVDAIHPGYGFLSESSEFADACAKNGITFIGPTVENLEGFADKTSARAMAIKAEVPVVPGTDNSIVEFSEAKEFVDKFGLPIIIKAAMGGGGKGMRVVRNEEDLQPFFESAQSEAAAAFGDGSCFLERYVESPRHIEVQIIGDGKGNAIHLWERDCSVQRRHQKVVEIAPAWNLPVELRKKLQDDAVRITSQANYLNAGTVEFLVDEKNDAYYFIEVNPRIQVEHTVTEEVTGVDIVQTQLLIAGGASFEELGLKQENIKCNGVALQCRITTENPERNFAPDTGVLSVYRHAQGPGMRVDGIGYSGMTVTPYYDSLLVKYTARAASWNLVVRRMRRALLEMRIRGVETNVPFLINLLNHPEFINGAVSTTFIDENPSLLQIRDSSWRKEFSSYQTSQEKVYGVEKKLRYIAHLAVNGHPAALGANPETLGKIRTPIAVPSDEAVALAAVEAASAAADVAERPSFRAILKKDGGEAMAKAIRAHTPLLITDTTWRDAHQSLLATRMRTEDIVKAAPATKAALGNQVFSLEMWGGATFDVSMRFLKECPWERLEALREAVPDVPFQMLLRGANAVGYTSYPDSLVYAFCEQAVKSGIDIFRVFDSLNYIENMELGIKAANKAGGFVESAICYTGDVTDTSKDNKYGLDYYVDYARQLVDLGTHGLAVKDMAGLLTPKASTMLIGALREAFPDTPIHVHTHDTAGAAVASMLAAAEAGADIVDCAVDSMSGMTSQPSMGAIVASTKGTPLETGMSLSALEVLNEYWEGVRAFYQPFESGQLTGSSDVYLNEIPGGQYTNLLFQSKQLGLTGRFSEVKKAYKEANLILGDIPKVTPSSKVVGDLAQFMVAQGLSSEEVVAQAESLSLPSSVIDYFQGGLGVPPGGFPEPMRTNTLKGRSLPDGRASYDGRPGAELKDYNLEEAGKLLRDAYGCRISEQDVLSYAMYPQVFKDYSDHKILYGDMGKLPTNIFLNPMKVGEEVLLELDYGRSFFVRLASIGEVDASGARQIVFEVNGERWFIKTTDDKALEDAGGGTRRPKASPAEPGNVGAPMPGVVVDVRVAIGDQVKEGDVIFALSAMKMEVIIKAPRDGKLGSITVNEGDSVEGDDLLANIV